MKQKIFKSFAIVLLVALLLCGFITAIIFNYHSQSTAKQNITQLAAALAMAYDENADVQQQANMFGKACKDLRVTFIEKNGTVLADNWSNAKDMPNHAQREELILAKQVTYGISIRPSDTVGKHMIYCATALGDGTYLRVSREFPSFLYSIATLTPAILLIAGICFLIALSLSRKFASGISAPILALSDSLKAVKNGTATLNPEDYPYEELQCMATDINCISAEVGKSLAKLKAEKDKINYILDNMTEGFVLLDNNENILMCNLAACSFFACAHDIGGKNIVYATRNVELLKAIDNVKISGISGSITIPYNGRYAEAAISPVKSSANGVPASGLVISISDITEKRNLEKMRQTFFSNASHELKTPITSIRGFAELLGSDINLPKAQQIEFCNQIQKETDRVTGLINDIILINRLESGDILFEHEILDIGKVIEDCCQNNIALAKQNNIVLLYNCQSATYSASRKEICELANNLIVNAIKYNHPGGLVEVNFKRTPQQLILSVHNTGDEIPPKYHDRIFERFFRIDKGRSRAVGGTGLGLSIVKHIALKYNASINLQSSAQDGTTITVIFPQNNTSI